MVKMGRTTALQKPNRGVRSIVVGDILRRLVARTISQQITPAVEVARALCERALSTRTGTECVSRVAGNHRHGPVGHRVVSRRRGSVRPRVARLDVERGAWRWFGVAFRAADLRGSFFFLVGRCTWHHPRHPLV